MSRDGLVPVESHASRGVVSGALSRLLAPLYGEIEERITRMPTRLNEYGFDPFGFDPAYARGMLATMVLIYRNYFRVAARGAAPPSSLPVPTGESTR